jgi:hypothetical protein
VDVPGLGPLIQDSLGRYVSAPIEIAALRGATCRIVFEGLDKEPEQPGLFAVARQFIELDETPLTNALPYILEYYRDTLAEAALTGDPTARHTIAAPDQVWSHVEVGPDARVVRDRDGTPYVDLECECDWDPEHGLNIVFREGSVVTKVGPYDGALTNATAQRPDLHNVVYLSRYL